MYKVFINEKKLTLNKYPVEIDKNLRYEGFATLEIAFDLLENTSCPEINVYGEEIGEMWEDFTHMFRVVEAAGGLVDNGKNAYLFIHRLGRWDMPKGKIEAGESMDQAALREVEEETGLTDLTLNNFLNSTLHIYRERNGERVLKTTYWYRMTYSGTKNPKPQLEEGITKVAWMDPLQIMETVYPSTFKNIRLILNDAGIIQSIDNL